jgi:two-component system, OmpR family, phosphate regulon sensor histidine kinase PhoR
MAASLHELVLDAIPSGVVVVDSGSVIKRCNPAVRSYLAMVPDPVGVHVEKAIPCPPLHRVIAHAFGGGEVVERVEGVGRFDLLLRAVPLDSGEGVVVVVYDVTELSGVERARSDFVAAVSHELRTPVTSILGFAETMLDHVDLDETSVYMVEAIKRNAERLSTLFQELLHLYRIEARESDLPLERVELDEMLRSVVSDYQMVADGRNIEISIQESETVWGMANVDAFPHIVGNLIGNAIKYTPNGGWVRIQIRIEGAGALVEVLDSGPGIDPAYREKIFERFFRVDRGRARADGGTGLGLSIVKHLCRASGAEVGVDSVPGNGSLFWVRFPQG